MSILDVDIVEVFRGMLIKRLQLEKAQEARDAERPPEETPPPPPKEGQEE